MDKNNKEEVEAMQQVLSNVVTAWLELLTKEAKAALSMHDRVALINSLCALMLAAAEE